MTQYTCSRCGLHPNVTLTNRGTPRVHTHKCPHGMRCQPMIHSASPKCGECRDRTREPVQTLVMP